MSAIGLSKRQQQCLEAIFDGMPEKAIGARLGISVKTVEEHIGKVYLKSGEHDRVMAVRWGVEHGYLPEILHGCSESGMDAKGTKTADWGTG